MAIKTFTTGEVLTAADTNTYLANGGLVFVASKTWTSTSTAQQIDNCFTSTYDNYRIMLDGVTNQSTPASINMRLVNGTTPDATGPYYFTQVYSTGTGTASSYFSGGTTFNAIGWGGDNQMTISVDIFGPQLAAKTNYHSQSTSFGNTAFYCGSSYGFVLNSTQYEGFTIYPGAGTFSGTMTVYGYRKV